MTERKWKDEPEWDADPRSEDAPEPPWVAAPASSLPEIPRQSALAELIRLHGDRWYVAGAAHQVSGDGMWEHAEECEAELLASVASLEKQLRELKGGGNNG